jgi:hypothetical protein
MTNAKEKTHPTHKVIFLSSDQIDDRYPTGHRIEFAALKDRLKFVQLGLVIERISNLYLKDIKIVEITIGFPLPLRFDIYAASASLIKWSDIQ